MQQARETQIRHYKVSMGLVLCCKPTDEGRPMCLSAVMDLPAIGIRVFHPETFSFILSSFIQDIFCFVFVLFLPVTLKVSH